jgi:peptidoglycan/xylan/chitin deacetylase (PgdA/CDA1 family)
VTDSHGNQTSVTRKVFVYEKQATSGTVNPGDKVIYLTFDDGPSSYTQRLLDILDDYGVKATFFVSAQSTKYIDLIGEAYRRGHTVGLHTYSHKYNEIYSSTDAYYADLKQIRDVVYAQTGEEPWLIRFPGGTGNSISKRYCSGIMISISQGVSYRGYLFCDWNVDSQDAIGTYSRSEIASNVIKQIKGKNIAYVLQHDLYKESVEAVEEIICWGLSNGYTFLPLEKDSPMIHQTLKN